MTLTDEQQKIVNMAVEFSYSNRQVFEFSGLAGTGKSVTLMAIIDRLGLRPNEYMPMAFTGAATLIMRMKGFPNAKSIHSSLYKLMEVNTYVPPTGFEMVNTSMDIKKKQKKFCIKHPDEIPNEVKYFIIDEGYMVPDNMVRQILSFGRKVIVTGDKHQLPPISNSAGFLVRDDIPTLTTIMRQAANNPILLLAHMILRGEKIDCGTYGNILVTDSIDPKYMVYSDAIICHTNRLRDDINDYVRESLGKDLSLKYPVLGDKLICRKNNWNVETDDGIPLTNGLTGYCINVNSGNNYKNGTYDIDFLPLVSNYPIRNLPINYEFFNADYETKRTILRPTVDERFKKYDGEMFEYAYAITCHLAQGQEFNNGVIFEEPTIYNIYKQWMYTAITRFKQNLIIVRSHKR